MATSYTFEDLSGATSNGIKSNNPFQDLIESCHDDPTQIQARYDVHRTKRNEQQRAKLLAPDFPGVTVDEILAKLEHPEQYPGFTDPRFCFTLWARPMLRIRNMIAEVQRRLLKAAPRLWVMPPRNLHMTTLEITHSLTAPEIEQIVQPVLPQAREITDFTLTHRARLVKPMVSFDAQALAVSFLPADGESGRLRESDAYTYHHLRRDVFGMMQAMGVKVASRYVIPSAHLTVGRFVSREDFEIADGQVDHDKVQQLIVAINEINEWLRMEYWPGSDSTSSAGEWIVGEEQGLELRKGALWYGDGGETIRLGAGF